MDRKDEKLDEARTERFAEDEGKKTCRILWFLMFFTACITLLLPLKDLSEETHMRFQGKL